MASRAGHVVFVCSSSVWAGTEKWTLRAAEAMLRQDREVTLVVRRKELFASRREEERLRLHELPFRNDMDLATLAGLVGLLRKADVVINTRVRDYWLGGIAARVTHTPSLLRLGVVRSPRAGHLRDRLRYGTLPTALLVNAEAIRDALLQRSWIDPEAVHVIRNGVDAPGPPNPSTRQAIRREAGLDEGELLVVGAGRLAVEKRWGWLIDAVSSARHSGAPVQLRLIGQGNEEPKLRAHIASLAPEVRSAIELLGPRADAADWLGAADIVGLPSSNEGVANTMLEAMGQAVPVVATSSGGVRELFRPGRDLLLSGTQDESGFAERLLRLAQQAELRTAVGNAGLAAVRRHFRWEQMQQQLGTLLDRLAQGQR